MDWLECNKKRIVKEVSPDREMMSSLLQTSNNKLASEEKLGMDEITASSKVSLAYDSLREVLEALSLEEGYKIYNHECYVAFLKEIKKKGELAEDFDEIRIVRNDINYYGKDISVEEAEDLIKKVRKLRGDVIKLFENEVSKLQVRKNSKEGKAEK